jgi:hypothetical protein
MQWSIGVTTVPERRDTTLPRTLASLQAAGWDNVRLFQDGVNLSHCNLHSEFYTYRNPRIGAWANWLLGLQELKLRQPLADRYLICQDDVVFSKHVRQYIDKTWAWTTQCRQWLNLYTQNQNEQVIAGKPIGWMESAELVGGGRGIQVHQGALALVFSNQAVEALLGHPIVIRKCVGSKATVNIDGSVGQAMNAMGWREMIHNPSLVDHIGADCSIIDRQIDEEVKHHLRAHVRAPLPKCLSFRGEEFDCLNLL